MHSLSWSPQFPHFLLVGEEQTMNSVRYLATSVSAIWLQKCISWNNSLPHFYLCIQRSSWLSSHQEQIHIQLNILQASTTWVSRHCFCKQTNKQTNKTIELILYSTTSSSTLVIYAYIWLDQKSFKDMPICMYCKKRKRKSPSHECLWVWWISQPI